MNWRMKNKLLSVCVLVRTCQASPTPDISKKKFITAENFYFFFFDVVGRIQELITWLIEYWQTEYYSSISILIWNLSN
jgi:hypothetical protein